MSFSVATYNVLATAYIHPARYRRSPAMVLNPVWRLPALTQYIANLATDVICLQEVEMDTLAALWARLSSLGYSARYARRPAGKPDGCAIFFRTETFAPLEVNVIEYADDSGTAAASGDIALIVLLRSADRMVGIANTHLAWEPPDIAQGARGGYRKIRQLLAGCESMGGSCQGWIICGDLNATPDSEVIAALERAGFRYAHHDLTETYTCNVNGQAKMIDYLFHAATLHSEPQPALHISDKTPLPSSEQPSDHLPLVSRFSWKS